MVLMLAVLAGSIGCGRAWQDMSSGSVGCAPDDIGISDAQPAGGGETWQATCNGKTFYCTETANGNVNCSPAP
jgi:hypothetical protein